MPELAKELGKIVHKCEMCHSSAYKPRKMYLVKPHGAIANLVKDYRSKICSKCYKREFRKK